VAQVQILGEAAHFLAVAEQVVIAVAKVSSHGAAVVVVVVLMPRRLID
jgi:hypothetical protein